MTIIGITASRTLTDHHLFHARILRAVTRLESHVVLTEGNRVQARDLNWIHGDAEPDWMIADYLTSVFNVPEWRIRAIPAKWDEHGRGAGFRRNSVIVKNAHYLMAVWDGQSRGALDTITKAAKKGLPIVVEVVT